jgi:hypothetical protein
VARFDERIEAFCAQASVPFALIHRRTRASLNWRYCDPRGGLFTVRLAQAQGRILGYSVLTLRDTVGHIADLLALPDRLDVVRSLVVDALRQFKASNAISVRCRMVNAHPYTEVLRRHGFEAIPTDSGTVYRPRRLGAEALAFLQAANTPIHLTMGDSDHI